MHRAYAPSISGQQKHGRTDVTNGLRAVVEDQRNLTFRNARAHIRRFPPADSGQDVTA